MICYNSQVTALPPVSEYFRPQILHLSGSGVSGLDIRADPDRGFGYADLFHHTPTALDLATCRIYDSTQHSDKNLNRYCGNDPIGCSDPSGLWVDINDVLRELERPDKKKAESIRKEVLKVDEDYKRDPKNLDRHIRDVHGITQ